MSALAEEEWLADAIGPSVREFFAELNIQLGPGTTNVMITCFANPTAHKRDDHIKSCSVSLASGVWNCKACGAKGNAYQAAKARACSDTDAMRLAKRFGLFGQEKPKIKLPGERQIKQWVNDMQAAPKVLGRLWELKGWAPSVIRRLQLGWDGERIVIAIRDHKLRIVGVVRYKPGDEKKMLAVAGTKRGLFPAPEIVHRRHKLFVVEGEPDAVSLWACGIPAVGVPGAASWKSEWTKRLWGREVVVIPDCDVPGRLLAAQIVRDVPKARVVDLGRGREDGFDVGDLVCEAALAGGLRGLGEWIGRL